MLIKQLPINSLGRDFVCGDIHGSHTRVEQFLEHVQFDTTKDRFFCAGDLIDRGPENEKCLHLLYEPWFHSVMGNHEYMMVDSFVKGGFQYGSTWLNHGGMWARDYIAEQSDIGVFVRGAVVDKMQHLPFLLTVPMANGKKFHIMHAEIYHDFNLTDYDLTDELMMKQIMTRQTYDGDVVLWGRKYFIRFYDRTLDERVLDKFRKSLTLENKTLGSIFNPRLSHIYSGHTIVREPVQFMGQTNLDTMAYGSYPSDSRYGKVDPPDWCGLTVTEPETNTFWHVSHNGIKEIKPVVI